MSTRLKLPPRGISWQVFGGYPLGVIFCTALRGLGGARPFSRPGRVLPDWEHDERAAGAGWRPVGPSPDRSPDHGLFGRWRLASRQSANRTPVDPETSNTPPTKPVSRPTSRQRANNPPVLATNRHHHPPRPTERSPPGGAGVPTDRKWSPHPPPRRAAHAWHLREHSGSTCPSVHATPGPPPRPSSRPRRQIRVPSQPAHALPAPRPAFALPSPCLRTALARPRAVRMSRPLSQRC